MNVYVAANKEYEWLLCHNRFLSPTGRRDAIFIRSHCFYAVRCLCHVVGGLHLSVITGSNLLNLAESAFKNGDFLQYYELNSVCE